MLRYVFPATSKRTALNQRAALNASRKTVTYTHKMHIASNNASDVAFENLL